ncbi:hypothetical protein CHS0354_024190 [Potamilus streckersoni]|uniref:Fucolectin tachylectin-4 pentraxin-1 domain-containing protein n=1 Tax=Potamilus streckersoni TaxID=2493646 RepID=A0AAE0SAW0_9BIVA|nr:hypothetical protein CHS0354_024190 [Potamilus streckersoni]
MNISTEDIIQLVREKVRLYYDFYDKLNVGVGKPASQSSSRSRQTLHDGKDGSAYTASLAVDGNNSSNFDSHSCSHTDKGHKRAWWEVDLKEPYIIKKIRIFKISGQSFQTCSFGSMISGKLENDEYITLFSLKNILRTVVTINTTASYRFKAIRIENASNISDAYVCLCEVEVFAVFLITPFPKQYMETHSDSMFTPFCGTIAHPTVASRKIVYPAKRNSGGKHLTPVHTAEAP